MTRSFPETIPDLLEWAAARAPAGPWLFFEEDTWTLADVQDEVDRCAVGLAERGVGRGDRVAMLLGNVPATLFAWLAANRLGAIAAPLDPAHKPPELAGVLARITPRVLVADEHLGLAEAARASLPPGASPAIVAPAALVAAGRGSARADVQPEDAAVLIPTSGTTGTPKVVTQTHRTYALTAEAFPWWTGIRATDRILATLPLFHINAQAYSTMGALGSGASLALSRRFSASRFWGEAKRLAVTQVNLVGAMVHILLEADARPSDRDHAMRLVYAALALPEAAHRAFEDRFGVTMAVGYGLSETTFGTVWPRDLPPRHGSMGILRQHPRLGEINRALVVRDDGGEAGPDEIGELWLDNPALMRGYWDDPAATAAAFAGRWFRTGDLVRRSGDGFFAFVSRKKDVIRRRGENVAAAEIELVLASHPDVREAAAIGVPSELGEQDIVAYVSPRPGVTLDAEALKAWTRERLADFKVPAEIRVRDSLPRTATERIAKHLLR